MADTLAGSAATPRADKMNPKKLTSVVKKLHFFG